MLLYSYGPMVARNNPRGAGYLSPFQVSSPPSFADWLNRHTVSSVEFPLGV